jgi:hypothetical protein
MLQRILPAFALIFFMANMVKAGIVSIKDKPIVHEHIGDVLDSKPEATSIWGPGDVKFLAALANSMKFPVAIWADNSHPISVQLTLDSHESWLQNLYRIKASVGDFKIRNHAGFIEIGWCASDRIDAIRTEMAKAVPPISLRSLYSSDFLTSWSEISGFDIKYDEDLIRNADAWENRIVLQREISLALEKPPSSNSYRQFDTIEKLPLEEFMSRLALTLGGSALKSEDGWVFAPFQRTPNQIGYVTALLDEIKKGFVHPSRSAIESLQKIGTAALPEILAEFRNAGGQYRLSLIEVLSKISSPERDAAFFEIAQELETWKYNSRGEEASLNILVALAETQYQPILHLLDRWAKDEFPNHTLRFQSQIALNIFDSPSSPKPMDSVIKISPSLRTVLETEKVKKLFPIAYGVLEPAQFLWGKELVAAEEDKNGGFAFRAKDDKGKPSWTIRIAQVGDNEAIVFVYAYNGYFAKLRKHDDRWLLTNWKLVLMQ